MTIRQMRLAVLYVQPILHLPGNGSQPTPNSTIAGLPGAAPCAGSSKKSGIGVKFPDPRSLYPRFTSLRAAGLVWHGYQGINLKQA